MPGGKKTITDHVREKSAADRAMLMRWVMSAEAASDDSVDWAFRSKDGSPEVDSYYGVQYAYVKFPEVQPASCSLKSEEWERLRAEHPYGVKVRVVDDASKPLPIIHESCLQFIESYEHALGVLSSDIKGTEHRAQAAYILKQQAARFKAEAMRLRPHDDESYEAMATRAKELKKSFHNVACNLYALMQEPGLASLSASAQAKKVEKARKPLEAAVNRYRAPRLSPDILVVKVEDENQVDAAVRGEAFKEASWQYYRRHTLRRAKVEGAAHHRDYGYDGAGGRYEPTATAHDPDYCLANFAVVSQGRVRYQASTAAAAAAGPEQERVVACASVTSRFGSPSPAKAYSGDYLSGKCKLPRIEAIRRARGNMVAVLRNEAVLTHEAGVKYEEMGRVQHTHVHLLSDASDSAQDMQIQDCAIAAYSLRSVNLNVVGGDEPVSVAAGFRYMDIGANWMRRSMSRQMYGMACMTLVDLFDSARGSFGADFLPQVELDLADYKAEATALSIAADRYIQSGQLADLDGVDSHEWQAHGLAIELSNSLKHQLQNRELRNAVLSAPNAEQKAVGSKEWRQFNAQQAMFVIMQLMPHVNAPWAGEPFRNRYHKNAFSDSCNCVLQALVPVLSDMLGEFGSSACKSNNDRAALVALRVSVFAQRMARGECITEGDLKKFVKELNEATAKEFEQSATHDHTEADCAGARSKGFPGDGDFYKAKGYKATAKTGSTATHKAAKWSVQPLPRLLICKPVTVVAVEAVAVIPAVREKEARDLAVEELQAYAKKYDDTSATCRFFSAGHHRRHTSIAELVKKINASSGEQANPCTARLLLLYVRSVPMHANASVMARRALQQIVDSSFGGADLTTQSAYYLAAEQSALVKAGVVWSKRGPYKVSGGKISEVEKAANLNCVLQLSMAELFKVVEENHHKLSFQGETLASVFTLISQINEAITNPKAGDELVATTKLNGAALLKQLESFKEAEGYDDLPKLVKVVVNTVQSRLLRCDLLEVDEELVSVATSTSASTSASTSGVRGAA